MSDDWYYIRCGKVLSIFLVTGGFKVVVVVHPASIARKVYLRQGSGIGALSKWYGGLARRGVNTNRFAKGGHGLIRHCLHTLEKLKVIEHHSTGGRRITRIGQMDLDKIASQVVGAGEQ